MTPNFFFQVFTTNSLIKNIFEEEKKFDSRTLFQDKTLCLLGNQDLTLFEGNSNF